eukprot:1690803-Rhodomonas_salina.3
MRTLLSAACELLFGVPVANAGPDAVFGVVRPHCALPQTPAVHLTEREKEGERERERKRERERDTQYRERTAT